jgi:hypothetical protein
MAVRGKEITNAATDNGYVIMWLEAAREGAGKRSHETVPNRCSQLPVPVPWQKSLKTIYNYDFENP